MEVKKFPWIADGAIHFLDEYLDARMRVLEFGIGGSTVWISKRCAHLVTIEHNPHWIDNVTPHITAGSWRPLFKRLPYHQLCEQWTDATFDLVLLDGKDRVLCAEHSVRLVKPGGVLMLDNANRPEYASIGDVICKGWPMRSAVNRTNDNLGGTRIGCTTNWWTRPEVK